MAALIWLAGWFDRHVATLWKDFLQKRTCGDGNTEIRDLGMQRTRGLGCFPAAVRWALTILFILRLVVLFSVVAILSLCESTSTWDPGDHCFYLFHCFGLVISFVSCLVCHTEDNNPFTPKNDLINFKFPLQLHQKYYITQYEELGFS